MMYSEQRVVHARRVRFNKKNFTYTTHTMHKTYEALHYVRYTVAKGTGLLQLTYTETT